MLVTSITKSTDSSLLKPIMLIFSRFSANSLVQLNWPGCHFRSSDSFVILCDGSLKTIMGKVQTNRSEAPY